MRENHIETIFKVSERQFEKMSCWDKLGLDKAEMSKLDEKQRLKIAQKAYRKLALHCHPDQQPGRLKYFQGMDEAVREIEGGGSLSSSAAIPKSSGAAQKGGAPSSSLLAIEAAPTPKPKNSSFSFFSSSSSSRPLRDAQEIIPVRIYFFGLSGSGISSLINALLDKPFDAKKGGTSGSNFTVADSDNYRCSFWEHMTLENEQALGFADIRVIAYECFEEKGYNNAEKLLSEYDISKKPIGQKPYKLILVSTKNDVDLNLGRVDSLRGEGLAQFYRADFVEVSSKDDTGIDELRSLIIKQLDILKGRLSKADSKRAEIPRLTLNESAKKELAKPGQLLLTNSAQPKPGQLLITDLASSEKEGGCTIM